MSRKSKILILATIFLASLFGLFLPAYIRARNTKASAACVSNLRIIDGAKQQWALENHKKNGDPVLWTDIRPYMGRGPQGEIPKCPGGGLYTLGHVGELPHCSLGGADHSIDFDLLAKEWSAEIHYERLTLLLAFASGLGLLAAFVGRGPGSRWLALKTSVGRRSPITWISLALLCALVLALMKWL